jgi:hypothetical protein
VYVEHVPPSSVVVGAKTAHIRRFVSSNERPLEPFGAAHDIGLLDAVVPLKPNGQLLSHVTASHGGLHFGLKPALVTAVLHNETGVSQRNEQLLRCRVRNGKGAMDTREVVQQVVEGERLGTAPLTQIPGKRGKDSFVSEFHLLGA